MKELSIEEKAKRYDEALKVLHKYDGANIMFSQSLKEEMFPELIEREDERIKKRIIEWIEEIRKCNPNNAEHNGDCSEAIAWIEKQGNLMKALQISNAKIGELIEKNYYLKEQLEEQNKQKPILDVEIPFGAKDSELQEVSYYIPEGFHAEIESNRVVIKRGKQKPAEEYNITGIGSKNAQGKLGKMIKNLKTTDNTEPKFKVGDIVKHKDNPHLTYILKRFTDDGDYEFHAIGKDGNEGCTCFSVVKYQDEWELVEQKPTVEMKTPEESLGIDSDTYNKIVDECTYGEQKPDAWSEEDEKILNLIIARLHSHQNVEAEEYDKDYHWLKSLKNKVQPKQEWSEEDESMWAEISDLLWEGYKQSGSKFSWNDIRNRVIPKLKSLRPQNRWKPSDEQIEALEHFVRSVGESGYASPYDNNTKLLYSLLSDLKKLREK